MTSNGDELADRADELYEFGRDEELLELARATWPGPGQQLPQGIADVCRLARLSCLRLAHARPSGDPTAAALLIESDVFEAHGLTAAALAGETRVVAGFLLPRFFSLIKAGAFDEARLVLEDMERLVNDGSPHRPFARVIRRLVSKNRAWSYFAEGRYADAARAYGAALAFVRPGSRGPLAVGADRALATFMSSNRDSAALTALRGGLLEVREAAQASGYPDLIEWSTANLARIDAGTLDSLVPYAMPDGSDPIRWTRPGSLP